MATFRFTGILSRTLSVLIIATALGLTQSSESFAELTLPSIPVPAVNPGVPLTWFVEVEGGVVVRYYQDGQLFDFPSPTTPSVSPAVGAVGVAVVTLEIVAVAVEAEIIRDCVQRVNDSGQELTPWERSQILGNPVIATGIAILDFCDAVPSLF